MFNTIVDCVKTKSLPDMTVYDIESGSYFDSYNSFKQTRVPVVLMYSRKEKKVNNPDFNKNTSGN